MRLRITTDAGHRRSSSAQSGPCRICSLEPGPCMGSGDLESLINSLSLRLHSHSGMDHATSPIRGGGRGNDTAGQRHGGVGGAGLLTDPERIPRSEGHALPQLFQPEAPADPRLCLPHTESESSRQLMRLNPSGSLGRPENTQTEESNPPTRVPHSSTTSRTRTTSRASTQSKSAFEPAVCSCMQQPKSQVKEYGHSATQQTRKGPGVRISLSNCPHAPPRPGTLTSPGGKGDDHSRSSACAPKARTWETEGRLT